RLDPKLVPPAHGVASARRGEIDPIVGVFWVPYSASRHPFHGQVMHLDMSPIAIVDAGDAEHVVGLGWFVAKDLRAEDRVTFSDAEVDAYRMPRMRIEHTLTPRDR